MGRPRGALNKKTRIQKAIAEIKSVDGRSDEQIVTDICTRFDIYSGMVRRAFDDAITALVVSGSAGVGKSYTAEWILNELALKHGIRYTIVRGTISAIDLYFLAYDYLYDRNIIVLDDADRIFEDEEALNILKSLLDTSVERKVNWMTDHPRFKGDNNKADNGERKYEKEFTYKGAMVFLTNKDFQEYIDREDGKYVEHMKALMSRAIYLDLKMHTRREVALWTRHIVLANHILSLPPIELSRDTESMLVDWLIDNTENLRELSIRTAIKLGKIFKANPEAWERVASILLLREDPFASVARQKKLDEVAKKYNIKPEDIAL